MMVWLLFIIGLMGLFFYNKIGSIISIGDLPTTEIIEPSLPHGCFFRFFLKKFTSKFTLFSPYCFRDFKANSPTAIGTTLEVLT